MACREHGRKRGREGGTDIASQMPKQACRKLNLQLGGISGEEWDCSHYCYSGPSVVLANALSSEWLPKESHHQGGLRLAQLVHLPAHRTLTWTPGFPRPSCPKLLLPVCLCVHCPDPTLGLIPQLGHRRVTPSWPISDVIT